MNTRKHSTHAFELKTLSEEGSFAGYGSVFGVRDSQGDIVLKGAFKASLKEWKTRGRLPKMLWQHRTDQPIGVWTSMSEDDHGLHVEGRILLDAGDLERRAYAHLKAGSIDALSIGYSVAPDDVKFDKEQDAYLLKKVSLWEVSPVTFPANAEALVDTVKAALEGGPKEFERFLREAGMSRSQAKGLMARGYDGLRDLRDADDEGDEVRALQKTLDVLRGLRAKGT